MGVVAAHTRTLSAVNSATYSSGGPWLACNLSASSRQLSSAMVSCMLNARGKELTFGPMDAHAYANVSVFKYGKNQLAGK
eukprot:5194495-Pleurochrysis_carterae.AAC.7